MLSSCTSYYYATIEPFTEYLKKDNNGELIDDNEVSVVSYKFNGENAPIKIAVMNKTEKALYVDWERSALILNGEPVYYIEDISEEENELIPSKSSINIFTLELSDFPFDKIKNKQFKNRKFVKEDGSEVGVKIAEFDYNNSPLKFGSDLILFSGLTANYSDTLYLQHDFYVSSLMKTSKIKPKDIYNNLHGNNNVFYVQKMKGKVFITIGSVLGQGVLIIGGAILEAAVDSE